MRTRVVLEPAYLLNRRSYQDSSVLLEAYTRSHGRVGLVARGARGPKSRLRGALQLFSPLLLSWSASGELGSLTGAEAAGPPLSLSGERVFHGWYLNELLLRLLQRDDPHPALFEAYALAVQQLPADAETAHDALRIFERDLLTEIGYGLQLPADLDPQRHYHYHSEYGPRPSTAAAAGTYRGISLIELRDGPFSSAVTRADARRLLREAIAAQLGGRPLATPRLLREMRAKADRLETS